MKSIASNIPFVILSTLTASIAGVVIALATTDSHRTVEPYLLPAIVVIQSIMMMMLGSENRKLKAELRELKK